MARIVKCAVGCHGVLGPELFFVRVQCDELAYAYGKHYEVAKEAAITAGMDGPFWMTDENDQAKDVIGLCGDWDSTPLVVDGADDA